jgi:hypothetical protein
MKRRAKYDLGGVNQPFIDQPALGTQHKRLPMWKTSRTASRRARLKRRAKLVNNEKENKKTSKKRDGYRCRFPLCGCRKLGLRLDSSHWQHKGPGGDPKGQRSEPDNLVTLCSHRHKDGPVSIDKHTLRPVFLTSRGYDGPIAWEINLAAYTGQYTAADSWYRIATERAVQQWEAFGPVQLERLQILAEMER